MENKPKEQFITTAQLAKMLGVSRITVFNKIKNGQIKAERVGRNFVINQNELPEILGDSLSSKDKQEIDKAVEKTIKDYGKTLRLLGKE